MCITVLDLNAMQNFKICLSYFYLMIKVVFTWIFHVLNIVCDTIYPCIPFVVFRYHFFTVIVFPVTFKKKKCITFLCKKLSITNQSFQQDLF